MFENKLWICIKMTEHFIIVSIQLKLYVGFFECTHCTYCRCTPYL